MVDLVGKLDVSQQFKAHAVGRFGGQIPQGFQAGGHAADFFGFVSVAGKRFLVRLKDHQPFVAVDDYLVSTGDFGHEGPGSDDGGYFQCFGDNSRMASRPAYFGNEAAYELPIEVGGFAGR